MVDNDGAANGERLLRVERLRKWFSAPDGQRQFVLHDISFSARAGEIVVIRGPNGCGKSTLLNLIGGLDNPSSGSIEVFDKPPQSAAIGYLFQEYASSLLPWMTLGENASLPLRLSGFARKQRRQALESVAQETGLGEFPFDGYPYQSSGGQQQKACFLRALLASEDFLILDEPFASLDRESREKVIAKLQTMRRIERSLVLIVVHDLDDAIFLGDRVICLDGVPATIRGIVSVDLPWPREPSMRVEKRFLDIRSRILECLGELH